MFPAVFGGKPTVSIGNSQDNQENTLICRQFVLHETPLVGKEGGFRVIQNQRRRETARFEDQLQAGRRRVSHLFFLHVTISEKNFPLSSILISTRQNVMRFINRIHSALRYIARAGPLHKWRICKSKCPNCNGRLFLSLRSDAFMTRCLSCSANVTNLSLIPVIQMHNSNHKVETAWEMSTYGATLAYLQRTFPCVYQSEFFENVAPGCSINGILNQDVQNLSFGDFSVDLITSNQVFEHIPDDIQGFRECHRILRQGGALIFSIPLYDIESTQQLASIENGEIKYFTHPEYHDSRYGGPNSALCFWRHSFHDIAERVSSVGFETKLIEIRFPVSLEESTFVIYAYKGQFSNNNSPAILQ